MGWLTNIGDAIKGVLKAAIVIVFLFLVLGLIVGWSQRNKPQAQATMDKVMTAGASSIGWAADGITGLTGGQAAHEASAGPKTIWVQSTAPGAWQVDRAIKVWNKGLTTAKLKKGRCIAGYPCIKVTVGEVITPDGQSLVLGSTKKGFFSGNQNVTFNVAAAKLPVRYRAFAACHELGHALGLEHSDTHGSCMFPSAAGSVARPDQDDYDAVNSQYGR